MDLISWGVNHKSAGLDLREKLSIQKNDLSQALNRLGEYGFEERIILSTCNRTEIYTCSSSSNVEKVREFASAYTQVDPEMLRKVEYSYQGLDVARHLFRVTASLDSMVVGEPEIVGQVKQAFQAAHEAGAAKKILNSLFQKGFTVAKKIRSETELVSRPISVGSVAVSLATQIFGRSGAGKILILGAGEMAEVSLQHFVAQMPEARLSICNRTIQKAEELAEKFHGNACDLNALDSNLIENDIVLCSLSCENPMVTKESLREVISQRNGRPLFFIDLGVPRNIEAKVTHYDEVYLYDMDDLQKSAEENMKFRKGLIETCDPYIKEGVEDFRVWLGSLENQSLISDIVKRNEDLIAREYNKSKNRLGGLNEEQEKEILHLVHRILKKAMHHPIHSLRNDEATDSLASKWRKFFLGE